jgi:ribonuclease HI
MEYTIHTDGGSRGNPGPGAVGACILRDNQVVHEISQFIGVTTNNEAEYQALLTSIEWLSRNKHDVTSVTWKLDSKLVIEQVNRNWKIKEPRLRVYAEQCWSGLSQLSLPYSIVYVPRAENSCADALVNQALDAEAS